MLKVIVSLNTFKAVLKHIDDKVVHMVFIGLPPTQEQKPKLMFVLTGDSIEMDCLIIMHGQPIENNITINWKSILAAIEQMPDQPLTLEITRDTINIGADKNKKRPLEEIEAEENSTN